MNKIINLYFSIPLILLISLIGFSQETEKDPEIEQFQKCNDAFSKCYDDFLRNFSPRFLDKFGILEHDDEINRITALRLQLANDPKSVGYIVVYGGKVNKYNEYKIRTDRMLFDLKYMGIDKNRIKLVRGGYRENFEFELWISPSEKIFPPLTPTVSPEKVKYKGRMKPFGPNLIS